MPVTFNIIETPQNDAMQMGAPGEESTWTRSLKVVAVGAGAYDVRVWDILNAAGVPKHGDRRCQAGTYSAVEKEWVCRGVDAQPDPMTKDAWNVRCRYTSRSPWPQVGRNWFKITRSTGFRTAAWYRDGNIWTSVPADGTVAFPPTSWIAGDKVDMNLQPAQLKVAQQSIQVDILWDRTRDRSTDAMAGAVDSPDPPSEWTSVYCNTRNNASFLGWPAGYVTYLGWTANQSPDEWLVVSHRFLADDWQHLEQRPVPNVGNLPLSSTASFNGINVQQHDKIFWYQPYRSTATFSNLINFGSYSPWSDITTPKPVRSQCP